MLSVDEKPQIKRSTDSSRSLPLKGFDKGIIRRLPGSAEVKCDAVLKLSGRALSRRTPDHCRPEWCSSTKSRSSTSTTLKTRKLLSEPLLERVGRRIHDRQNAKGSVIEQSVRHEVHGPNIIGRRDRRPTVR